MISILHRYVLRELAKSFLTSFLVLTGVMLLGALYTPLRHGLNFGHVAQFLPYALPYLLAWTVPAATLAACVMSYGRLSADNELVATSVSGVPLRYMCYPAFALAGVLAAATVPLNNWVIPQARTLKRQTLKRIFIEQPFRISMVAGHETMELGEHKIYVEAVEGQILRNVVVIAPRQREDDEEPEQANEDPERRTYDEQHPEVYVYRARQARYSPETEEHLLRIELREAEYTIVTPGRNARSWLKLTADEQVLEIPMENPVERLSELRRDYLTRSQLIDRAEALKGRLATTSNPDERRHLRKRLAKTRTEVHLREALSVATLALTLVGVPLGIWIRRESRLASFAVAVLVFLLLYALIAGSEGLALRQRVPPALALWTPDLLTGGLGAALLVHLFRH
ncbi:MAG: LptF/LptG family permease [Planctomycetota bacterium]